MMIFGVVLLAVGLIAYFYPAIDEWGDIYAYPYQNIGIILTIAGIVFAGLSFFVKATRETQASP